MACLWRVFEVSLLKPEENLHFPTETFIWRTPGAFFSFQWRKVDFLLDFQAKTVFLCVWHDVDAVYLTLWKRTFMSDVDLRGLGIDLQEKIEKNDSKTRQRCPRHSWNWWKIGWKSTKVRNFGLKRANGAPDTPKMFLDVSFEQMLFVLKCPGFEMACF